MLVTKFPKCIRTHRTSQGAVVTSGVPRVSTSTGVTVSSCRVVDAAVAVARLRVAYLWHGARVRVPITVTGDARPCRFKQTIRAHAACRARESRLTFGTYRAPAGICKSTNTGSKEFKSFWKGYHYDQHVTTSQCAFVFVSPCFCTLCLVIFCH